MRRLLARALSIGADPSDDEEQRLRKILLLTGCLVISRWRSCGAASTSSPVRAAPA